MFTIESTQETSLASESYSVSPDVIQSVFRSQTSVMVIGEINKGNPAFKDWSMRLSFGEKLPRGKYFHKEQRKRSWLHSQIGQAQ